MGITTHRTACHCRGCGLLAAADAGRTDANRAANENGHTDAASANGDGYTIGDGHGDCGASYAGCEADCDACRNGDGAPVAYDRTDAGSAAGRASGACR